MVSHHCKLEYVALIRAGLGGKCSVEGSHGVESVNCSAGWRVANVAVHQIIVVAVVRSAGARVCAGIALSAGGAYHCACHRVKNNARTYRHLDWLYLIQFDRLHGK